MKIPLIYSASVTFYATIFSFCILLFFVYGDLIFVMHYISSFE